MRYSGGKKKTGGGGKDENGIGRKSRVCIHVHITVPSVGTQVCHVITRTLVLWSSHVVYVCTHIVREDDTYVHVCVLWTSQANNQNSHVGVYITESMPL